MSGYPEHSASSSTGPAHTQQGYADPRDPAGVSRHEPEYSEYSHHTSGPGSAGAEKSGLRSTENAASGVGKGIKSAAAKIHGMGEELRGTANAAVDHALDEPAGVRKNEEVVREGRRETETGEFGRKTREREGLRKP